jgi:hypothetical protein
MNVNRGANARVETFAEAAPRRPREGRFDAEFCALQNLRLDYDRRERGDLHAMPGPMLRVSALA